MILATFSSLAAYLISFFVGSYSSFLDAESLKWNQPFHESICLEGKGYIFVEYENEKQCLRYYPSSSLNGEKTVVIQLYGDRDISSKKPIEDIKNNTKADQEKLAKLKFEKIKVVPWVILARPGTYGSSGDHRKKRMISEFLAVDKALDELKLKYDIDRFIIVGHSGGATIGAALLTLGRTDIQCAILSSGTYDYLARRAISKIEKKNFSFDNETRKISEQNDPYFNIEKILIDPNRKVYILGDSRDRNTPFHLQLAFAFKMMGAGHQVEVVEVEGRGPSYHNVSDSDIIELVKNCSSSLGK